MATILSHVGKQRVHDRISRRVDQRPAFPPKGDEVRVLELAQVERQRRRREPKLLADFPRRNSFGAGLHEQPKNIEPRLVPERYKGGYGFLLFHISNMMEL